MPAEPERITDEPVTAVENIEKLLDQKLGDMLSRVAGRTAPKAPNVHPDCLNVPRTSDDGFEELCHLVTENDPDTALCGKDVAGYPWNPPWPLCEACLVVSRGEMN